MRISTLDLLNFCCVLLTLCCSGISVVPLFPRQLLSQLLGLGLLIRFDAYLGNIYILCPDDLLSSTDERILPTSVSLKVCAFFMRATSLIAAWDYVVAGGSA